MQITDFQIHLYPLAAQQPPYRWRDGLPGSDPSTTGAFLRVITDRGVSGVAFTHRGYILQDIVQRRFLSTFIGRDPLQKEELWHVMWNLDRIEELPLYIFGLLDNALWDITAKVAGLPLYQLLGGFRKQIPAYASTVTFETLDEYLEVIDQCLELGYPAIKLHAWGDVQRDAKLCRAVRQHVGPDIPLMYDGSAAFDLADAIFLGRVLADCGYLWFEEPMREFSISAYQRLAQAVPVALNVAETSDGAHMNTADFLLASSAPYVRTSAFLRGGITGAMRIAHLADAFRIRAEVHGSGLINRHLCMSIPNTTYYESLVTQRPVIRENCVDGAGLVHAPEGPGIGFEREWENQGLILPWER